MRTGVMLRIGGWDLDLIDIPAEKLEKILKGTSRDHLVSLFMRVIEHISEIEEV